tara:strand:- start:568 stop:1233 length:666 start_codon:yes stop_codon:yes gene_type:complete
MIPFILKEGLYDPGIFKAFFLAGGPGSGKTYVTRKVTGGLGLKNVNSDAAFEKGLKKAGLSLKMPDSEKEPRDKIRTKAKELTQKSLESYIGGRLGLVIDSTGRDYSNIAKPVMLLNQMGYDCYMIFVNTSLDVALKRNAARDRTVDPDLVKKSWNTVQQNMGKFQRIFGQKNMIILDNNNAKEDVLLGVYKQVMKLVKKPIQNHIAKKWMKKEAEKRKRK